MFYVSVGVAVYASAEHRGYCTAISVSMVSAPPFVYTVTARYQGTRTPGQRSVQVWAGAPFN